MNVLYKGVRLASLYIVQRGDLVLIGYDKRLLVLLQKLTFLKSD
jgi:hypothetical protein